MTEPETQTEDETDTIDVTEDETVASDVLGEVKTDTVEIDVTEDATSEDQTLKYSTDYESEAKEELPWTDEEQARETETVEIATPESAVARLPGAEVSEPIEETVSLVRYFPLGERFQLEPVEPRARTTVGWGRRVRTPIWRSLRTTTFRRLPRNGRLRPCTWPLTRDAVIALETRQEKDGRRRDVLPYEAPDDDKDERKSDFANRKELGHARVLVPRPGAKLKLLVDRATGERHGLVNGDYVTVMLPSKRVYANVVLRGTKGMHLLEMSSLRERKNTWKFCFYQAVVALLVKTQLRYKYAWSVNIDYIYDQAWMLFTHIGTINVKKRQRLDDVVVYNYKYSVEIEFIRRMQGRAQFIDIMHKEGPEMKQLTLSRKDPLQVRMEIEKFRQKVADSKHVPAHKLAVELEETLGKLIGRYRNCILRTFRFSLAFWQDGLFWYLYNPYRCDEYGFWHDKGRACIVKFCSADSLRRHLMILMLRCHAGEELKSRHDYESDTGGQISFVVELFHVTFQCCQLDNLKLLQRRTLNKRPRRAVDEDPSESLDIQDREDDEIDGEQDEEDGHPGELRERATWLRRHRATTWGRCAPAGRKRPGLAEVTGAGKARWHHYYVEEPNRLFSLWGELHITDDMFDEANRGMQTYACYVVCAGMTRITAPEYWSSKTLDAIVVCGDRYYTCSTHEAESVSGGDAAGASHSSKCLADRFDIGKILFEVRMLPAVHGRLYAKTSKCLWSTLERVFSSYHFAVLTCESVCLGLFKFCGAYYVCDVNSFGPPFFHYGHGAAYLMRATSYRKFVTVLVLLIGSPERSRFSLNPIEILRIVEVNAAPESRAKTREGRHRFGRSVKVKKPGKLSKFTSDGQEERRMKK
ncbi:PREDICTED: uncharacterized protein LOC105453034 [Wasmannia auropunctata]|uniref:uncharacterized protein LOC105453034 n=1 Tax=Wasmannia auropunctata TaxID=64793 RepID=UPI0005EE45B4|nr:PREDICTED: uncharacterized protein LOC105453034 [Wasmannia auropunctata]